MIWCKFNHWAFFYSKKVVIKIVPILHVIELDRSVGDFIAGNTASKDYEYSNGGKSHKNYDDHTDNDRCTVTVRWRIRDDGGGGSV